MADARNELGGRGRRTPVQKRSRSRVQDILAATGELLDEGGVEAVTTRALADRADMSVAGIYQYFPNRDTIIDAYLEQATSEVDSEVVRAVGRLDKVTVRGVLEAAVLTHARFYQRNSELVRVWQSANSDSLVLQHARERNTALGHTLRDAFVAAGFMTPQMPDYGPEFVVEMCTRALEFAFRVDRTWREREEIAQMGINMVLTSIEVFLTPRALEGITPAEFAAGLSEPEAAIESDGRPADKTARKPAKRSAKKPAKKR
jgi:AcrR family transcriptional regulator